MTELEVDTKRVFSLEVFILRFLFFNNHFSNFVAPHELIMFGSVS